MLHHIQPSLLLKITGPRLGQDGQETQRDLPVLGIVLGNQGLQAVQADLLGLNLVQQPA